MTYLGCLKPFFNLIKTPFCKKLITDEIWSLTDPSNLQKCCYHLISTVIYTFIFLSLLFFSLFQTCFLIPIVHFFPFPTVTMNSTVKKNEEAYFHSFLSIHHSLIQVWSLDIQVLLITRKPTVTIISQDGNQKGRQFLNVLITSLKVIPRKHVAIYIYIHTYIYIK